ncbi:Glutathione S-transferase 2 [Rhizina undulata]
MASPDVILYGYDTPNVYKVSITLEELDVKYEVKLIDIRAGVQKQEWFLKINPNGRVPAIVEKTSREDFPVFESGGIQLYLAEKFDKSHKISFPHGTPEYWELVEWLFFLNSDLGSAQRSGIFFSKFASEKIPFAIGHYRNEVRRIYTILNDRLKAQKEKLQPGQDGPYLIANKYSLADIAAFPWNKIDELTEVDTSGLDELVAWRAKIHAREPVVKGLASCGSGSGL